MRLVLFGLFGVVSAYLDKTTLGNIKKLTIKTIRNQGFLQDDYECLADKGNDEILLEYESGGQKSIVLDQSFGVNGVYRIN